MGQIMEASYWNKKWEKNEIGFHETEGSELLVKYFERIGAGRGNRVFVPLCGKTRDIAWLLARGCRVVGAELSEIAVQQLFEELGVMPVVQEMGNLIRYSTENLEVFVGDVFKLTPDILGKVDTVYDRAALVALPGATRSLYASHLQEATKRSPQLLITFVYDQALKEGPPFSIGSEEVERLYGDAYRLTRLASVEVGFRGQFAALEEVWMLE